MKNIIPYSIAIVLFILASLLYFNPVLSGKTIKQGDIMQYKGMAKASDDFRKVNNNETYWISNAFSGMPAYQVSVRYPNDFLKYIDGLFRFLPRPADYLFMYFISFFVLLISLKVHWKLAVLGALSFGFSTYLIIIFGAGHNAKAHAIAYMPLVIAGFLYVFRRKYILGFTITALAMSLELYANHLQMTYYLGFCLLILGIVQLYYAYRNKQLVELVKQSSLLIFAVILALGVNATRLMATKEYASFSTRGASELTINPDGSSNKNAEGLDKSYITEYSYGKLETFNLIVPRYMGGGTVERLTEDSNFYKVLSANADETAAKEYASQALTYWGAQPIVEAPAYIGAIVCFLFFLGVFIVKGRLKYWLVGATVFSILLSWGKNFGFLTDFFINYVPLYNKFRAVSSIQVIAELCAPLLGVLALKSFFFDDLSNSDKQNGLKKAIYTVTGIILGGFLLAQMTATFEGIRDAQYQQLPGLLEAIISDRKSMLFTDTLRSLVLVFLVAGILFYFLKNKINLNYSLFGITLLVLFDLISVAIRYVNSEDFVPKNIVNQPFTPSQADKQILEDKSYYRVANFTGNFMNEARTSYFHNSIGGYHAAKMKRYQELFDYQFGSKQQNPNVLNMLNVKYLIVGADKAQLNPEANGNAWFVDEVITADTADQEMKLLTEIDTKETAIISLNDNTNLVTDIPSDSTATIELKEFKSDYLKYQSSTQTTQFAVFSEVFYKDGWNAYVDDVLVPHVRTNYVLRGMNIPKGNHTITFKFEPKVIKDGAAIALMSYVLLLVVPIGWFFIDRKKKLKA